MVDEHTQKAESQESLNGSLRPLLDDLQADAAFTRLVQGDSQPAADTDTSLMVQAPQGIRPALAAAAAGRAPVVLVVPSERDAQEMTGAIRSWYEGDPGDVALLRSWETLPHERLSPRADTVASTDGRLQAAGPSGPGRP